MFFCWILHLARNTCKKLSGAEGTSLYSSGWVVEDGPGDYTPHSVSLAVYERKRDVAQPGSAPEWGSGGRGFKSRRPDFPLALRGGIGPPCFRRRCSLWSLLTVKSRRPDFQDASVASDEGDFFFPGDFAPGTKRSRSPDYREIFFCRSADQKKFFLTTGNPVQYFVLSSERLSSPVSFVTYDVR
jgi:hypothetical protein